MKKPNPTEFMSVREAARYLGINEKKLYFLANAHKIPSTRVTGKWIFPKQLIDRWIEESASSNMAVAPRATQRAAVLLTAGSDDPSLSLLQELSRGHEGTPSLFMATVGSSAGLQSIRSGIADFATAHLLDPDRPVSGGRAAQESLPNGTVIVQLFYRELGWLVQRGNPLGIESVRDLARPQVRFVNRQPGSGTRIYFDQQLMRVRVSGQRIAGYNEIVSTHLDVGLRVMSGRCDVGLATRTTAQLLGLDFVPLTRERFDMLVPKERFLTKPMQNLLGVVAAREFRNRVSALGGYDVSESGRIIAAT
jgi:excisionase family DNA binding protein